MKNVIKMKRSYNVNYIPDTIISQEHTLSLELRRRNKSISNVIQLRY